MTAPQECFDTNKGKQEIIVEIELSVSEGFRERKEDIMRDSQMIISVSSVKRCTIKYNIKYTKG